VKRDYAEAFAVAEASALAADAASPTKRRKKRKLDEVTPAAAATADDASMSTGDAKTQIAGAAADAATSPARKRAKPKTLTPRIYAAINTHFATVFGPFAGWAHSVLFAADLPAFSHRLPEHLRRVPEKKPRTPRKTTPKKTTPKKASKTTTPKKAAKKTSASPSKKTAANVAVAIEEK
jgi:hypothetical protein